MFGNALATLTFSAPTHQLEIISRANVELKSEAWPVFDIAASAGSYLFLHEDQD